jgi:hypothetical protein
MAAVSSTTGRPWPDLDRCGTRGTGTGDPTHADDCSHPRRSEAEHERHPVCRSVGGSDERVSLCLQLGRERPADPANQETPAERTRPVTSPNAGARRPSPGSSPSEEASASDHRRPPAQASADEVLRREARTLFFALEVRLVLAADSHGPDISRTGRRIDGGTIDPSESGETRSDGFAPPKPARDRL